MKAEHKAVTLGVALALLAWAGDALLDVFLSGTPVSLHAYLHSMLVPDDGHHLYSRVLAAVLLCAFGVLAGRILRQRRMAQDDLRRSRRELEDLLQTAPYAMWELDPAGRVRRVNTALERLLGCPGPDLVGLSREALVSGSSADAEVLLLRPDGRRVPCACTVRPLLDAESHQRGTLEAFRDLSAERDAETRFQTLVASSEDVITIVDPEGRIVYGNPAFGRLMGRAPSDLVGQSLLDLAAPESEAVLRQQLSLRRTGASSQYELHIMTGPGVRSTFLVSATPRYDGEGQYQGSFAVLKDVTAQHQAEDRLSHLNSVLRAIRDVNQLITREKDADQLLRRACEILTSTRGYALALVGLCSAEGEVRQLFSAPALPTEEVSRVMPEGWLAELPEMAAPTGHLWTAEGCLLPQAVPTTDPVAGRARFLATQLQHAGCIHGFLCIAVPEEVAPDPEDTALFREVADDLALGLHALEIEAQRTRSQEQLQAERDRSWQIVQTAGALIVGLDREGRVTLFNRACEEATGFAAAEILGRPLWVTLIPMRFQEDVRDVFRQLSREAVPNQFENPWLTKSGAERLISWRNTPIADAHGQVQEILGIGIDVTEHRAAELAIRDSEERYRLLFHSANDAIFLYPLDKAGATGCFLEVNDVACRMFGYSRLELLRMRPEDLDAPEEVAAVPGIMDRLRREGRLVFTQDHLTRDGQALTMEVSTHLLDYHGQPAVLSIARDISERKQAADRLAHLNAVLLAIRNVNQLITREHDPDTLVQQACDCLVETRGYGLACIGLEERQSGALRLFRSAAPGLICDLAAEDSRRLWRALMNQEEAAACLPTALLPGDPLVRSVAEAGHSCLAMRIQQGDHRYGFMLVSIPEFMADNQEECSLFAEVVGDLAFALRALEMEAAQQDAQRLMRLMDFSLTTAQEAITWVGPDGRLLHANQAACDLLGYAQDELLELHAWDIDLQVTAGTWVEAWEYLKGAGVHQSETSYRRREGGLIATEVAARYIRFDEQEYLVGFARDITQRLRTAQELRRLNDQYSLLVESNLVGTFMFQDDLIIFANAAIHRMLGYEPGELVGSRWPELVGPASSADLEDRRQRRRAGGALPPQFEAQVKTQAGGTRWLEIWSQQIDDYAGKPTAIGHAVDITEARELRRQLEHSQRLEALGTLAGGVAHEFNNVLQAILLNASLLQLQLSLSGAEAEKLHTVIERTEYGARLTEQLLTFSRRTAVDFGLVSMSDLLQETADLLGSILPRQIALRVVVAPEAWPVTGDAGRLKQVLINLCLNARDAMPEGGTLTLTAHNCVLKRRRTGQPEQLPPGRYVVLAVADTGTGMDEETQRRVFEPFFTTKGVGQGTGLGLSIVHGIVEAHGGCTVVQSAVGQGTTITIYLPAPDTVRAAAEFTREARPVSRGQNEVILVVDDEAGLLEASREILESFGYRVLTAACGTDALQVFAAHQAEIALVVLDLMMPGMSGQEVLERLRQLRPHLPVLIASGYIPEVQRTTGLLKDEALLEKPFSMGQLLDAVRTILDYAGGRDVSY